MRKGGEIWVNLNESRNKKSSELLQAVRDLKSQLQSIKEDNERILKAQEELNHMLLSKIHNPGNDKTKEYESNIGTISCKHKGNKLIFYEYESNSSRDNRVKLHREKHTYSSVGSDNNPKRKK